MSAVWVALIVAGAGLIGPLLLARLTDRQRRAEKAEDYARQDAVTRLLLASNERVATQTEQASEVTNGKLDQIHELVNSTLTGAMEGQLLAVEAQLVMVRRFQPDEAAEIAVLEDTVAELRTKLADRARQTLLADAQVVENDGK